LKRVNGCVKLVFLSTLNSIIEVRVIRYVRFFFSFYARQRTIAIVILSVCLSGCDSSDTHLKSELRWNHLIRPRQPAYEIFSIKHRL